MIPQENLGGLEEELNGDVQNMYVELFEKGHSFYVTKFRENKIKPQYESKKIKEAVQKGYLKQFKEGEIYQALAIERCTHLKTDIETVFEGLKEYTHLTDKNDILQKTYLKNFRKGQTFLIEYLNRVTGIGPNYSCPGMKKAVQKGYFNNFRNGHIKDVKILEQYTKIKYDTRLMFKGLKKFTKAEEDVVQRAYLELFKEERVDIESAVCLNEFTGLKPDLNFEGTNEAIENIKFVLIAELAFKEGYIDITFDVCRNEHTNSFVLISEYVKENIILQKFNDLFKN